VSPHGDFGWVMDELEVAGFAAEVLVLLAVLDADFKESVVETIAVGYIKGHGCEFLVGGVVRRGNVMGQEHRVCTDVAKADYIIVLDVMAEGIVFGVGIQGKDLPDVIRVVMGIPSHLLPLRRDTAIIIAEWVFIGVAVEIDFGLFMLEGNPVVVFNFNGVHVHGVITESFLEFRRHEVIPGTRSGQNGKMHLEPKKVEEKWDHNQANHSCDEMLAKLGKRNSPTFTIDVEKIPEIDTDCGSNREE
jgi:hypothetical protein